jgi:hypothetical protein
VGPASRELGGQWRANPSSAWPGMVFTAAVTRDGFEMLDTFSRRNDLWVAVNEELRSRG